MASINYEERIPNNVDLKLWRAASTMDGQREGVFTGF